MRFVAVAALSALFDFVIMHWHEARQSGRMARTVLLSMLLELLGAVPIMLAIASDDWTLLLAGVIGSAVGTGLGMWRKRADGARPE